MAPGTFIWRAALMLMAVLYISQLNLADGAVPNHRLVLPPVPGYIPVYIQYGDMPPDPNDFWIFQTASKNVRPQVSPAIYIPSTTTEVRDQPEPLPQIGDTPTYKANSSESSAPSDGKGDKSPNGIPEASHICGSCVGNEISKN